MPIGKTSISPADLEMEFDWLEFWIAVKGRSDSVVVSYLKALTYYYHHLHCRGIINDDRLLRSICECDESKWDEVKPVVFGEFFKKDNGLWNQKRSRQLYNQRMERIARNQERAEKAAKQRWKNKR